MTTITTSQVKTLTAISDPTNARNAILATFRGYCSELFVFGKYSKSGCTLDHTASGQERCIQSFALLTKRELIQHGPRQHKNQI
jgi:hypothetical protein